MKKRIAMLILIAIVFSGCAANETDKTSKSDITGKYVCASDYYGVEFFARHTDGVPFIVFYEDGSCELFVNYFGGTAFTYGAYRVENVNIFVELGSGQTR